jgi:hypothetical protein
MENEFMKNAKHFSDEEVAWPNTLGQLLVCIREPRELIMRGRISLILIIYIILCYK